MILNRNILLELSFLVLLFSCTDSIEIKRKHVGADDETLNQKPIPHAEINRTDSGIGLQWDWIDYYRETHTVSFFIPRSDVEKGQHNRLYEITTLPMFPNEIDYGSLIRSGGISFMEDLSNKLKKIAAEKGYDSRRLADAVVCMVQNIPYTLIHQLSHQEILDVAKKQHIDFLLTYHNDPANSPYHRDTYGGCQDSVNPAGVYSPAEFISSLRGDCDTRTLFLFTLMKKMGYDVAILNGPGHSMLGCTLKPENPAAAYVEKNGARYYFWETTVFYNVNNMTGPRLGDALDPKFNAKEWKIMIQ